MTQPRMRVLSMPGLSGYCRRPHAGASGQLYTAPTVPSESMQRVGIGRVGREERGGGSEGGGFGDSGTET